MTSGIDDLNSRPVSSWRRRFLVRGVFWRQLLRWAVLNAPGWLTPLLIGFWAVFFLIWGPGRRGVMQNLRAIHPGSSSLVNFGRTLRVFWNFAWSLADNALFKELRILPDWQFEGLERFEELESLATGGIILTAHMGNYDLGAHLFSERTNRKIIMVRAPEVDPQTRDFERESLQRTKGETLKVDFNTMASDLAIQLLDAVRHGTIAAIQGDRVTPGIATIQGTLFGRPMLYPAGPFVLAMTARVPIYPLFVTRVGWRRYRVLTFDPITVERRSRDRDADLRPALQAWTQQLEGVIRESWYQWFAFEPFEEAPA